MPDVVICGRCATACDGIDNFCRQCGLSLQEEQLPSVRQAHLPAVRSPSVRNVVVRGAAFVAAGKIAEIVTRQLVQRAFSRTRRITRLPARRSNVEVGSGAVVEEEHLLSETFLLRRTRVRR